MAKLAMSKFESLKRHELRATAQTSYGGIYGGTEVEMFKVSLPLVATAEKIKEQLDLVLLRESCRDAMKAAYDWKLMVYLGQVLSF